MITDTAVTASVSNKELPAVSGDVSDVPAVPIGTGATEALPDSAQLLVRNFSAMLARMQKPAVMTADTAEACVQPPAAAESTAVPTTMDTSAASAEIPLIAERSIDSQTPHDLPAVAAAGPPVAPLDLASFLQFTSGPAPQMEPGTPPRSDTVAMWGSVQPSDAPLSATVAPSSTAGIRDESGFAIDTALAALARSQAGPSQAGPSFLGSDADGIADAANTSNDWSGALPLSSPSFIRNDAVVAAVAGVPLMPLSAPLGTDAWQQQLGNQINWLLGRGEQSATLSLSPAHLGPVEVRLSVREGEASVMFGAAQAETRHALEAAMPRLREMLASSGIALTNAGVSQHAPHDPRAFTPRRVAASGNALEPVESTALRGRTSAGLLDLYA